MAWLASLFQDGCDFSKLTGPTVQDLAVNPSVPWLEVGFSAFREPYLNTQSGNWEVVYTGPCFAYPDDGTVSQDTFWNVSRAFDFLALVLGGAGCFFLWFTSCCVFSRGTWRWTGYELLLASIFQSLSFLWFKTSLCHAPGNSCGLFWGSKADIVSAVLWMVAAFSIFCRYPVPRDQRGGDGVWRSSGSGANRRSSPRTSRTEMAGRNSLRLGSDGESGVDVARTATTVEGVESANDDAASSTPSGTPPRSMPSGEDPRQDGSLRSGASRELKDVELT
jgi:hypothetical protein